MNKSNLSDQGGIIDLGNKLFYYDSWSYQCSYDDAGNAVYTYTFTLSDGQKNPERLTNDRVGKMASIGKGLEYQGIPYYMNQMNEWIRSFSQHFNDILQGGYDSYNNPGNILFAGKYPIDDEQYDFPSDDRYDLFTYEAYQKKVEELVAGGMTEEEAKAAATMTVESDADSYYKLTAKNFGILTAVLEDANLLANRNTQSDGVEQNDLLSDLKSMAYNKEIMSFRGCSASEFLQCVLGDVALNANRANTFSKNYENIAGVIDNQRLSISGVDEDEEAVNLVKYQNGYNLASKMIQTLTEIYDRLILETGV